MFYWLTHILKEAILVTRRYSKRNYLPSEQEDNVMHVRVFSEQIYYTHLALDKEREMLLLDPHPLPPLKTETDQMQMFEV